MSDPAAALLLTVLIFALWAFTGRSLLWMLRPTLPEPAAWLLAPAFGMGVLALCIFTASRWGAPVEALADPMLGACAVACATAAIGGRAWRGAGRVRYAVPYVTVLAAALLLSGWPMLRYGFDWLAFVNGDFNTYSLSALRLLHHAYSEVPDTTLVAGGQDHSLKYWFLLNTWKQRSGADLLLAFVSAVSGRTVHQMYMPLIVAMQLALCAAAGGLAAVRSAESRAPLAACVLTTASALCTLGVTYQLLAQVAGIALLVACSAMVPAFRDGSAKVRQGIVMGLCAAALMVTYPEVLPFLALFVLGSEFLEIVVRTRTRPDAQARPRAMRRWAAYAVALAVALLVTNRFAADTVQAVLVAFRGSAHIRILPNYLLPSGLPALWGWVKFSASDGGVILNVAIATGIAATVALLFLAVRLALRGVAAAQMTILMLAMAAYLFARESGFGLFKLAMFIQPFMMAGIAMAACGGSACRRTGYAVIVVLAASMLPTQQEYVRRSLGNIVGATRVPFATSHRVAAVLRDESARARREGVAHVYSDASSTELDGLEQAYFQGMAYDNLPLGDFILTGLQRFDRMDPVPEWMAAVRRKLGQAYRSRRTEASFEFRTPCGSAVARFERYPGALDAEAWLLATGTDMSVINFDNGPSRLSLMPLARVSDRLVFVESSLGSASSHRADVVALHDPEADVLLGAGIMAASGRYHLYQVLNPRSRARLAIALSASVQRQDDFTLPKVAVQGAHAVLLPLVGRGSARVLSQEVEPLASGARSYLGLDFCRTPTHFTDERRAGLMALYGISVPTDPRDSVAFVRDISLMSDNRLPLPRAPTSVSTFPRDLRNPALEYSGLFEDGWMSEAAYVWLARPGSGAVILDVSGLVPDVGNPAFRTRITVRVAGELVFDRVVAPGDVEARIPLAGTRAAGRDKIEIEFEHLQRLPGGDGRPVSMLVKRIALEPGSR